MKTHSLGNLWAAQVLLRASSVCGMRLGVTLFMPGPNLLGGGKIHQVRAVLQIVENPLHVFSLSEFCFSHQEF